MVGANTPVVVKVRRLEERNKISNTEAKASVAPQVHPGGKTGPLGSPCGLGRMKQPTLRSFLEKRSWLEGSLRQAVGDLPFNTTAGVTGGRDLLTQPNIGTKGRFGDSKSRQGMRTGPVDNFVEREKPSHRAS